MIYYVEQIGCCINYPLEADRVPEIRFMGTRNQPIIKYAKNLAKIEEKTCLTCLKLIP